MLPKKLYIVSPYEACPIPASKNCATKPDLFISMETLIIPAHRKRLMQSNWIREKSAQTRILVPTQPLNKAMLQQIVNFFYGCNIEVADLTSLTHFFEILEYMRIKSLRDEAEVQIINNIREFDTFIMLEIGYQFELQKIIRICFQYLQIQQFEQMKYFQYSLFESDFRLFQIILRRHHILKMAKKIDGLSVENIQELILVYCRRRNYSRQIQQRLFDKYILPWRTPIEEQKIKTSLRLHKLPYKNLGQSTTIYGDQSQKREKQLQVDVIHNNIRYERPQSNPVRMRKYTNQMEKLLAQIGLNPDRKNEYGLPSSQKMIKFEEMDGIITEQQFCFNEYINVCGLSEQRHLRRKYIKISSFLENFEDEIEQFGSRGSIELKRISIQDQIVKKPNTKSMVFQDVIQQSVQQSMIEQKSKKNNNVFTNKNVKGSNYKKY